MAKVMKSGGSCPPCPKCNMSGKGFFMMLIAKGFFALGIIFLVMGLKLQWFGVAGETTQQVYLWTFIWYVIALILACIGNCLKCKAMHE